MVGFEEGINFDGSVFALDEEQIAHGGFKSHAALFCNGFAPGVAIHNASIYAMKLKLAKAEVNYFFQRFGSYTLPPITTAEDISHFGGIVCKIK